MFDRTSGVSTADVVVGFTSATAGAAFQCGLDGAPLTPCVSPIALTTSGSLRVQATKAGYTESSVTESTYTIEVAAPVATPGGHTFEDTVAVAWASTPGAAIHYTTDGSEPTLSAPLYTGPLVLSATTTVKARAWKAGCDASPTTTEVYTRAAVAAPVLTPAAPGPYEGQVSVSITSSTEGAEIHYTVDSQDGPTLQSPTYQTPLALAVSEVSFDSNPDARRVRAAAFKDGAASAVAETTYTLTRVPCGYVYVIGWTCAWWGETGCEWWVPFLLPIPVYCRVPPVEPISGQLSVDEVDFDAGVITVTGLNLPATGVLTLEATGYDVDPYTLATDPAMGNGTHQYSFNPAVVPPGQYTQVRATWTGGGRTLQASRDINACVVQPAEAGGSSCTAQTIPFARIVQDSGNKPYNDALKRDLWYQVFYPDDRAWDQGGNISEQVAVSENECHLFLQVGELTPLNPQGQFPDTYYTDARMCSEGCTMKAVQNYSLSTAGDQIIRRNNVEWTCSGISVTERPR